MVDIVVRVIVLSAGSDGDGKGDGHKDDYNGGDSYDYEGDGLD